MDEAPTKTSLKERVYNFFPKLDRNERKDLVNRIGLGAEGGVDFIVMMLLAATLASLGLLQGSTAVVIGAMLVAPLMGPLVAAGLALTQGNFKLFRSALTVCGTGVLIGLGASLFFGITNPGFEVSMEVEARGNPDLLDLVIAFASGMVAAYAMGRPSVSGTLAGVAIAAALLPPLAVIGIGLTNGELIIAVNAAVLFTTNLVAIILGAALIFRLLGIHAAASESNVTPWVRKAVMSLALITVILTTPLLLNVVEKGREGQRRPAIYPTSPAVRHAVWDYINSRPELNMISLARHSVEPDTGITLLLTTTGPIRSSVRNELIQIVRRARGNENAVVRVFTLVEAPYIDLY